MKNKCCISTIHSKYWKMSNNPLVLKPTYSSTIDPFHKSHNASVPYPIMHHFVTEMCTWVHISVTKWCFVGYLSDTLWALWDASIRPVLWLLLLWLWLLGQIISSHKINYIHLYIYIYKEKQNKLSVLKSLHLGDETPELIQIVNNQKFISKFESSQLVVYTANINSTFPNVFLISCWFEIRHKK